ncbi:MAG: DUF2336 domain-containing protein, partial [Kiloniellales bacterium]
MTGHRKTFQRLMRLAADRSVESRKALVTTINDLFAENETQLSDRELALISDILNKLLGDFEVAVRRELAERLANKHKAPMAVVVALANDEIGVARPVLLHSDLLDEPELIAIVQKRTREHQMAIAMRRTVSQPVSDALVGTGDGDVITTLLKNPNARISRATMIYLVEQSRHVDSYQEPLILRQDLSPGLARRLYAWVSADLRTRLLDRFDIEAEILDEELADLVEELPKLDHKASEGLWPRSASRDLAQVLAEESKITPELLVRVLRQGEIELFEALFCRLIEVGPSQLHDILYREDGRDLAAV